MVWRTIRKWEDTIRLDGYCLHSEGAFRLVALLRSFSEVVGQCRTSDCLRIEANLCDIYIYNTRNVSELKKEASALSVS